MNNKKILILAVLTVSTGFLSVIGQDTLMPEGGNPNHSTCIKKPRKCSLPESPRIFKLSVSPRSKAKRKEASQQKAAAVLAKFLSYN